MTAIDRTAYPRPGERLTREELQARYHLTETDRTFIRAVARGDAGRLTLAALLKTRRDSGRFPSPREIPGTVLSHLAAQLGMAVQPPLLEENRGKQTLHRYRTAIRAHLGSTAFSKVGEGVVTRAVLGVAETMSDPADLINRAIEALRDARIDATPGSICRPSAHLTGWPTTCASRSTSASMPGSRRACPRRTSGCWIRC